MSKKLKLLSFICFLAAMIILCPCVSKAYENIDEVPVNYTIKLNKIDSADNKNLVGAKFQLTDKDGNVIGTQTTDSDGILSFGNIKSFGEGTDIYYIDEIRTPKGYVLDEKETIEVDVQKTITNVETGAYKLKITCSTLNYDVDITRYDFVPVSTVEELKSIGSDKVFTYEGKQYKYTATTNYKLMNDIDLDGIDWDPIDTPIKGIFDGNGHKISNLTLNYGSTMPSDKKVALFKDFTGIVQDLTMDNVNVVARYYDADWFNDTTADKSGIAAFAAHMGGGTFKNCTVSGSITSCYSNVGSLVGYGKEDAIIKFINCTNNVEITASQNSTSDSYVWNVGGLIGYSESSLSLTDCTNNGEITGNAGNVGGLVGSVQSEGYTETAVKAGYAEDGNTITLLVGNSRTEGEYDLYLEDYDLRTLNILPGGTFTVYDAALEPIEGFENIKLEDGKLKIGTMDIKFEGKDVYFVKDVTPVDGYRRIAGYIKVTVTRYWDFDENKFKVTVDEKVIAEDKIGDELGGNTDELDSVADSFAPEITFENIGWNNAKATFIRCNNNAPITGFQQVAGMVGKAWVAVTMDECNNNSPITVHTYGKAGGLIGSMVNWHGTSNSVISNSNNYAEVQDHGTSTGSAGGIVGQIISDLTTIENCTNTADVTCTSDGGASGIVCDNVGSLIISGCTNEGNVIGNLSSAYSCDTPAGGMLAKCQNSVYTPDTLHDTYGYYKASETTNTVIIKDCIQKGDVSSTHHFGGFAGLVEAKKFEVSNCQLLGTDDEKLNLLDYNQADKGGIVGYLDATEVSISDCIIDNVDMHRVSDKDNVTYGVTGGIVGNWCEYGWAYYQLDSLNISGCNVTNSNIETDGQSTGGILGGVIGYNGNMAISIEGSTVDNCTILNKDTTGTYCSSAGILAMSYGGKQISIADCKVENTSVESRAKEGVSTYDQDVAGIVAMMSQVNNVNIDNVDLTNVTINNYTTQQRDGCANASAGLGYVSSGYSSEAQSALMQNCDFDNVTVYTVEGNCSGLVSVIYNFENSAKKDAEVIFSNNKVLNSNLTSVAVGTSNTPMSAGICVSDSNIIMKDSLVDNTTVHMDTQNPASGTNVTGYLGIQYSGTAIFDNCDVKDSEFKNKGAYYSGSCGLANVAGIAGMTQYEATFENCDVTGTKIIGDGVSDTGYCPSSANVAGIAGCLFSKSTISNCNVSDCEISGRAVTMINDCDSTVAGMVGVSAGSYNALLTITDSKVENCNFTTGASCTGGFVGVTVSDITVGNIKSEGNTIVDNGMNIDNRSQSYNRSIGGVVGSVNGKFEGSDIEVTGLNVTGQAVSTGGVAGYIATLTKLENATVDGFTDTNDQTPNYTNGSTAGLVGDIWQMQDGSLKDCSVTNTEITTKFGNASGFVGTIASSGTIDGATVDNVTVKNINAKGYVKYNGTYNYSGEVGGIVAYTNNEVTIKNSEVVNSDLEDTLTDGITDIINHHVGGLVGLANDSITIDNCKVESDTLVNNTRGITGGYVGMVMPQNTTNKPTSEYKLTVQNTADERNIVKDLTIINDVEYSAHAGGISGVTNEANVSKTDFTNVNISSADNSAIMVGTVRNGYAMNEEDCTITDSSVTTKVGHAAGVTTQVQSDSVINKLTVDNLALTAGENCTVAAGIAVANNALTATDVTIENCDFNGGKYCPVGGVAAYVYNLTTESTDVKNTKITGYSDYGYGAGAIAGVIGGTFTSTNDTVEENCEITARAEAGGMVGFLQNSGNAGTISNATVKNTTIKSTENNAGGIVATSSYGLNVSTATISNVEVNGYNHAGGVAGSISGTSTLSDVTVDENSTVTSKIGCAGGILGVAGSGAVSLPNATVSNVDVTGCVHAGGLVGVTSSLATVSGANVSDVTVANTTENNLPCVGGYFGVANGLNITSSSLKNATLNATSYVGGIAGVGNSMTAKDITLTNVTANSSTASDSAAAAGLAGVGSGTINGVTAKTIVVNSNGVLAGGIAGVFSGPISNVDISDVTIREKSHYAEVGGIVGVANGNITSCTVDDADLYGIKDSGNFHGDVGGIAGVTYGVIDDCTVKNSTIVSDKQVGGLVGVANGNVTNSTVDNCQISMIGSQTLTQTGGDAGGAVGSAQLITISGVTVTNTTVFSSKLAGGVLGAGYLYDGESTVLENLTVDNNTLVAGLTGKYIAAPDLYEEPVLTMLAAPMLLTMNDEENTTLDENNENTENSVNNEDENEVKDDEENEEEDDVDLPTNSEVVENTESNETSDNTVNDESTEESTDTTTNDETTSNSANNTNNIIAG